MITVKGWKLDDSLKYVHLAQVTVPLFRQFPIDMLRRDRCMPNTELDAGLMASTFERPRHEPVTLIVCCYSSSPNMPWTTGRWKSFGCEIVPITSMEAGQFYNDFEAALAAKA
jgi:hypothetical protein